MITIYGLDLSVYCAKVRVVLRHKGLDWQQLPPPGGYNTNAYKEVVPSGNLPTLVDGDLMLADSEAINEYLNEIYPEPPLLPNDPEARAKSVNIPGFMTPAWNRSFANYIPISLPKTVTRNSINDNRRKFQPGWRNYQKFRPRSRATTKKCLPLVIPDTVLHLPGSMY